MPYKFLRTSEYPTSLALLEVAISVPFNGENPSSSDEVLWLELPDVDEVKHIVVKPGGDLR